MLNWISSLQLHKHFYQLSKDISRAANCPWNFPILASTQLLSNSVSMHSQEFNSCACGNILLGILFEIQNNFYATNSLVKQYLHCHVLPHLHRGYFMMTLAVATFLQVKRNMLGSFLPYNSLFCLSLRQTWEKMRTCEPSSRTKTKNVDICGWIPQDIGVQTKNIHKLTKNILKYPTQGQES